MKLILTNKGEAEINVLSYEPSHPTIKLGSGEGPQWGDGQYQIMRGHRHKQKRNLIVKGNSQVDFPIFIENVHWTWIKIEEYALRGECIGHENDLLKLHFVNVRTDHLHNFTVFTYRKQEPDLRDEEFLERDDVVVNLDGEDGFIDTAKDNFHQKRIDLDLCLMNDNPPKPEDINSPVWLYILRGTY